MLAGVRNMVSKRAK